MVMGAFGDVMSCVLVSMWVSMVVLGAIHDSNGAIWLV